MTLLKWPGDLVNIRKRPTKRELYESVGLLGRVFKYTILADQSLEDSPRPYDFYLQLVHYAGEIDFIALTLSGLHDHNIRALMEVVCREATRALRRKAYTLYELTRLWRGYHFAPFGVCPQVEAIVQSPLDAAAILIERNYLISLDS
jgi:hypothetical protein